VANRHYSFIASDFIDLTLRNGLGVVVGIDYLLRGLGTVSVSTVDSSGDLASFTLLDILYGTLISHNDPAATIFAF
jgi:hypothetical protein